MRVGGSAIRPLSDFLPHTLGGALCAAFFASMQTGAPPTLSRLTAVTGSVVPIPRVVDRRSEMTVSRRHADRHRRLTVAPWWQDGPAAGACHDGRERWQTRPSRRSAGRSSDRRVLARAAFRDDHQTPMPIGLRRGVVTGRVRRWLNGLGRWWQHRPPMVATRFATMSGRANSVAGRPG